MPTEPIDPRLQADPEDRSDVAKDPTDPATNAAQAAAQAGVGEQEWEGLTREETADLNKEAYEANQPKTDEDNDVERILPTSLPPAPLSDPTSVSPADPQSDPGRAKAARDELANDDDDDDDDDGTVRS